MALATCRVAGPVSGLLLSLCLAGVTRDTWAADRTASPPGAGDKGDKASVGVGKSGKVKSAGRTRAKRPAPPAPPPVPAPAAQAPLVELEDAPTTPPPSACKVPLRTETVATERVRTGLVSLRWTIPPQRLEKTELRFQQQTTELDLGSCYRQYMTEKNATSTKPP